LTAHHAMTATTSTGDQATILSVRTRFQVVRISCPSFCISGTLRPNRAEVRHHAQASGRLFNTPRLAMLTCGDVYPSTPLSTSARL
jgi:hypothetical protein